MGVSIDPGGHDLLRNLIAVRELQPASLEPKKIVTDVGRRRVLCLAGAVRGVGMAVFNFLGQWKRHLPMYPSQFALHKLPFTI